MSKAPTAQSATGMQEKKNELLNQAAGRAVRYLEGLDERPVFPAPEALAGLAAFDEPLPERFEVLHERLRRAAGDLRVSLLYQCLDLAIELSAQWLLILVCHWFCLPARRMPRTIVGPTFWSAFSCRRAFFRSWAPSCARDTRPTGRIRLANR